jgi:hypothetical protein
MSIFGSIMSAIFGKSAPAAAPAGAPPTTSADSPPTAPAATADRSGGGGGVDVEKVLSERAAQKQEKLDWRKSIVDLMKVLDLDSSLTARKQLASELGYKGELNGSAEMNIWLHKQVMQKLAANGGKVPADLTS